MKLVYAMLTIVSVIAITSFTPAQFPTQPYISKNFNVLPIKNLKFTNPLLKISFDGGLCPDGDNGHVCHTDLTITRDGKYTFYGEQGNRKQGNLEVAEFNALINDINNGDFTVLKAKKFAGLCPTAYDGAEETYTFYTPRGLEIIASCQVAIDDKSPFFIKVR